MFKNMKIPVENNLDEIVVELEKRGLHLSKRQSLDKAENVKFIGIFDGWFEIFKIPHEWWDGELTTLAELKEM